MNQETQSTIPLKTILATAANRKQRLDLFLGEHFSDYSRSRVQSLIKEGHVTLRGNKVRCSEEVKEGDLFIIQEQPQKAMAKAFAEDIPLNILYEDDDLLVVNKPAGMVVHVGVDHEQGTLVNALLHRWKLPVDAEANQNDKKDILLQLQLPTSTAATQLRPGIVHRLDKETSGCIIVAKDNVTHATLSALFSEKKVKKTYLAVTVGRPRQRKGTIDVPIGRHPVQRLKMTVRRPPSGRESTTDYEVLAATTTHALIACYPHTGRMHQIRVHLQQLGFPVVGDPLYGKRDHWKRHLLHAWKLEFTHPRDGRTVVVEAPLPEEFSIVPWKPKVS